ncbi:MAG: hypothetical protein ACK5Z0_07775 [Planctomycetota bacterium]|jgi:hypothetical protein
MPVSLTKLLQPSALLALLVVIALLSESGNLKAQELSTTAAEATSEDEVELRFRDYEAKIQAILKTRLNEEKAFVTSVMEKVRAGEIPEKMVETSYKWVLNKHPDTNYPFVYFERVLRIQGDKAGIEIPPFDYEVYRQRLGRRSSKDNS